jgi:tetraacyldisaccharide 4'-kinase
MIVLHFLLFPFAVLYDWITRIRNRMYDQGLKPSVRFEVPVISVGNLTVGGTGKTPMIEYLIRLLSDHKLATLSRGYGRRTKGFRIADAADGAATLGDEPFQLYRKFGDRVVVAVGEERALAIPSILQEHAETEVILLDDAYQHRRVIPSLNILLSDYNRPFYIDYLLPSGRLREARSGAGRADMIVVTKCPTDLSEGEMATIRQQIHSYADRPLFFSRILYGAPVDMAGNEGEVPEKLGLVSGIANPIPLERYVSEQYKLVKHFNFADHHVYTVSDMLKLKRFVQEHPGVGLLTTEKDRVKLDTAELTHHVRSLPLFYLPIELEFVKSGKEFDAGVIKSLSRGG